MMEALELILLTLGPLLGFAAARWRPPPSVPTPPGGAAVRAAARPPSPKAPLATADQAPPKRRGRPPKVRPVEPEHPPTDERQAPLPLE